MDSFKEFQTRVYENWKNDPKRLETSSGAGSTIESTETVRKIIKNIIDKYNIESITDVTCGDFNWMRLVDLTGIQYLGIDVVDERVKINKEKYGSDNIKFRSINILNNKLKKKSDLVICRSIMAQLKYENSIKLLNNILHCKPKYVLLTSFPDFEESRNLNSNSFGEINVEKRPFNFTCVLETFNENDPKLEKTKYKNKSLVLLKGKNLKDMVARRFSKLED